MSYFKTLKDKIVIDIKLELLSGMHIGGSDEIATIGAVDSVVVRDPITNRTMIPGSSLKGKMRYLLLRTKGLLDVNGNEELSRLFGDSKSKEYKTARLQFCDSLLSDESVEKLDNKKLNLPYSEIKFENKINNITGIATPRQIERAVRGSIFDVKIIYNVEDENELEKDFENIEKGLELLENDYIGGSGTRGYGRVKINDVKVTSLNIMENVKYTVPKFKNLNKE